MAPPDARTRKKKKKGRKGKAVAPPPPAPKSTQYAIALLLAFVLAGMTAWAWPARPAPEPHVVRGNQLYDQRHYRDALDQYQTAPGAGARNAGVQLDRGLARYRVSVPPGDGGGVPMLQADAAAPEGLTQAQDELRTAARGGTTNAEEDVDAFLRARAAYDLGNTLFSQHHWDNAIDAYKEALRLRPGGRDAAWNLELARRLRELERNPPDAGTDAGPDASDANDTGNDANDTGSDGSDSGSDGGGDSGGDSGGQGDGGQNQPDGGSGRSDGGTPPQQDASAPADAATPRTLGPLDELDRSSHSLQQELLRRHPAQPRSPDEDR